MKRPTTLTLEPLEGRALLSGLSYSITTNQTAYQPGQPVVMTFTETNVSDRTILAQFGPSIDGFSVSQGGKVIWQSNSGATPMYIALDPLQPGQTLTRTATWNGVPTGGSSPVTGTFTITDQLNVQASATVTITGAATTPTSTPASPTSPQPAGGTNSSPAPSPISTPISQDPPSDPSGTPVSSSSSPIAVAVSTAHPTYRKGHPVRMTMTLRNVGDTAVALPAGSTEQFTVFEGSAPVWHKAGVVSGTGSHTIKVGHSVKLTADWSGKVRQAGSPLTAGTYTLVASDGSDSAATTFQVD
jgi:hypothetical protein